MDESRFKPEDYEVLTENGKGVCIQRSDGASIPICPGNRDYDEFVQIDTEAHLCPREHHPTEEEAWTAIRSRRDALLTACDWTQIPDAPLAEEERAAWQTYRQALRDIPQAFAAPEDVVWPDSPMRAAP